MSKYTLIGLVFLTSLTLGRGADLTIRNGGFEDDAPGAAVSAWFIPPAAAAEARIVEGGPEGKQHLVLSRQPGAGGFGNLMQCVDATPFRGRRIRFSADVSYKGPPEGRAQLWCRVDRPDQRPGFFDNMDDRPITDGEWKRYEITGDVDEDAQSICLGLILMGTGPVHVDHVQLTDLGERVHADKSARPLEGRAIVNLTALSRLVGYVRHFHPSDEARALDWNQFTIAAVEKVEPAKTPEGLVTALRELFGPVAPGVVINVGPGEPSPRPADAVRWRSWLHHGYGQQQPKDQVYQIYTSQVVDESLAAAADKHDGTPPGTTIRADLGDGVTAIVPIGCFADGERTLPRGRGEAAKPDRPAGWKASGEDRSTRLAAVVLAWNVYQHFYPYFDVVKTDWPGALSRSLTSAATDATKEQFQETLGRLGAALHDGHTWIQGPAIKRFNFPFVAVWAGENLVIARVIDAAAAPGVQRGDVITAIGDDPVATVYERTVETLSGATSQWLRWRSLVEMGSSFKQDHVSIQLRRPGAGEISVRVTLIPDQVRQVLQSTGGLPGNPSRPRDGDEVSPGIRYFNLDGAETTTLEKHMAALADSPAVIFDLRGYPGSAGAALLPHLTDRAIQSAHWNIPEFRMPDREGVTFTESHWNLPPQEPRFNGKVVFLTNGSAISYAESCMGIVEGYGLGEIVGSPTAGTNGNVNQFSLPGGYSMSFTGMQVIKHDGTPHHGVGILPTVAVTPTAAGIGAGKDEVLEKSVELCRAALSNPAGSVK